MNKEYWKWLSKKTGKSIKQLKAEYQKELAEQKRCEFCGEKGHTKCK